MSENSTGSKMWKWIAGLAAAIIAGVVISIVTTPKCERQAIAADGMRFTGVVFPQGKLRNADECAAACRSDKYCVGWNHKIEQGTSQSDHCWLFHEIDSERPAPQNASGKFSVCR